MSARDMRLLMVSFVNTDHPGVLRKVHEQVVAMREHIPHTVGVVVGDNSRQVPVNDLACTYVHVPGGAYTPLTRAAAFHVLWEVAQKVQPDIVYFRYPMYDSHTLRFVREVPGVVFEIQTKADREMSPQAVAHDAAFARQILPLSRGLVAVTDEILDYETARAGVRLPGHVMSNGMNADSVCFTPSEASTDGLVEMVCAAQFAPWHGIDRLLAGMAMASPDVRQNVVLHLAGEGDVIAQYKAFVQEFGLENQVRFYGRLTSEQLTPLFARSHIAIGSLAMHRIGLEQLAVLKNREYCLRGIPFVFAGEDMDFPAALPFVRQLPSGDEPLALEPLLAFARSCAAEAGLRQRAREYGETQLPWTRKMADLAPFLGSLVRKSSARAA